jgi:hypothetical protein
VDPQTPTWQSNQLKVSVTTTVKATCKIGTRNTGYSRLEWDMDPASSQGYSSDGKEHTATISKSVIESALGIQEDQQNSQSDQGNSQNNNSNSNSSKSSSNVKVPLTLYVSCRNAEDGCQGQNLESQPASVDCGNFPAEAGQQGSQNPENKNQNQNPNQNQNQNQNQTALTVSSCTAQTNGSGSSASVNLSASTNGPATCTYNINGSGSRPMQGSSQQYTDSVLPSALQSGNNTFNIT